MSKKNGATRPKIAFFEFTSCEGCQLTVVDSLQDYPELLEAVEIVQFREAMSAGTDDYLIAFIEGSYTRSSDELRIKKIRDQAQIVVALGACAHIGGINAIRNARPSRDERSYVYGDFAKLYEPHPAHPLSALITVDAFIPGCPIDRQEFIRVVKALLMNRKPDIPDYPVCVECKLKENKCRYQCGGTCLGPVTRAGCQALCPTFNQDCIGCRGLIPNPNLDWLKVVMGENGLSEEEIAAKFSMFLNESILESEVAGYGPR
jgi:sulfhydrogenase subunit delta